jgi:heme A synthase
MNAVIVILLLWAIVQAYREIRAGRPPLPYVVGLAALIGYAGLMLGWWTR